MSGEGLMVRRVIPKEDEEENKKKTGEVVKKKRLHRRVNIISLGISLLAVMCVVSGRCRVHLGGFT